jgi:uncharacterized protein YpmB
MKDKQRQQLWFYVFVGLAAIGILNAITVNPMGVILPVVVIGAIFLLYKYPPSRWRSMRQSSRTQMYKTSDGRNADKKRSTTTKRAKFRVIRGTKREDDDNDNIPKYH